MGAITRPNRLFKTGVFAAHHLIGRGVGLRLTGESMVIAAICAIVLLLASHADGALFLEGKNVGLLEHPGIWAFILLQASMPTLLQRSVLGLLKNRRLIYAISDPNWSLRDDVLAFATKFSTMKNQYGQLVGSLAYLTGFSAFIWNSYQNQQPIELVGFDFWDSSTFQYSYWVTRIYKFYMFVIFLPKIALVYIGLVGGLIAQLNLLQKEQRLKLRPFSQDGVGGYDFVPSFITRPMVPAILVASLPNLAAFYVHGGLSVTPIIGATIIGIILVAGYGIPILFFRRVILKLKSDQIIRLSDVQQEQFETILLKPAGRQIQSNTVRDGFAFRELLIARIRNVSEYPHLRRILGALAFVYSPTLFSMASLLFRIATQAGA